MAGWTIALLSSLGGGVVGGGAVAWLTQTLSDRSERRKMQRDVLLKLAGHRYLLTPGFAGDDGEFWVALNQITVAFAKSSIVMEAFRIFQQDVERGFQSHHLARLIGALAKEMGLPAESLDSGQMETPFTPKGLGRPDPLD